MTINEQLQPIITRLNRKFKILCNVAWTLENDKKRRVKVFEILATVEKELDKIPSIGIAAFFESICKDGDTK